MQQTMNLKKFYQYAFPMQATLVTCNDAQGNTNIITVAWHTTLSKQPPLYGISLAPQRHSHDLIKTSQEFVINFMPYDQSNNVHYCGTHSGRNENKLENTTLSYYPSTNIKTPGITQAYARFECQLHQTIPIGDHTFFIGHVVHLTSDEHAFNKEILQLTQQQPLFYLGGNTYTNGHDHQRF